jgi:hypothetical protein
VVARPRIGPAVGAAGLVETNLGRDVVVNDAAVTPDGHLLVVGTKQGTGADAPASRAPSAPPHPPDRSPLSPSCSAPGARSFQAAYDSEASGSEARLPTSDYRV